MKRTDPNGSPEAGTAAKRKRLPSLLSSPLRRLLVGSVGLSVIMLADSTYLVLVRLAETARGLATAPVKTVSTLYQVALLGHTLVGLVLAVLLGVFLVSHLPKVWVRRHRASILTGVGFTVVGITLTVTGLFIFSEAASRQNGWAWWVHVGSAGLVVGGYAWHRWVSYVRPFEGQMRSFVARFAGLAVLFVGAHAVTTVFGGESTTSVADRGGEVLPAGAPEASIEGFVSPAHRFFPSPVTTSSGEWTSLDILVPETNEVLSEAVRIEAEERGFAKDQLIGAESCVRCHAGVTEQWATSAHRFASFNNPFYEASIRDLREGSNESNPWVDQHLGIMAEEGLEVGTVKSKWCAGCHDPALLLTGQMTEDFSSESIEAQTGLTCLACHRIQGVVDRTGNGNYVVDDQSRDPYVFAEAPEGTFRQFLHDAALKARPAAHRNQMATPLFSEPEFCASCHKVSLSEPVNNYRWLRGQNEFDNWDDSGVSLNAARTFYLPSVRRVCQDCHMPLERTELDDLSADNGMVRSHRFLGPNTALPFLRGDTASLRRIEAFLQEEKLRVDVFAMSDGRGDEARVMGLGPERMPALETGRRVSFDVVVRNQGVGHTFPGGTNDSNQGWLEVTIRDQNGATLAVSGSLLEDGSLKDDSHVFKALLVDRNGSPIARRNAQDIHVTVFANVIGPGSADLARYEWEVPPGLEETTVTVTARLLWRKFDQAFTRFAFEANPRGFRAFEAMPSLPVTEIDRSEHRFEIVAEGSLVGVDLSQREAPAGEWVRYNDYGIALFVDGNTRGARSAFEQVELLRPDQIDGPLNLAKVALLEGDLEVAYEGLQRAEALEPGSSRVAWVWGEVLREDGRYDDAVLAYERVLTDFPGDRASWRALGRTLYLDQQFDRSLEAYGRVLEIDPEDLPSHYHRMLNLRALGRDEAADRAESTYLYYSVDESAQEITRAYRLENEAANLMAQPIPTHRLVPPN